MRAPVRLLRQTALIAGALLLVLATAGRAGAQDGGRQIFAHEDGRGNFYPPPAGDQGAAAPACNPLDGASCPRTDCELIIDDDSDHPGGITWNGDRSVRPVPATEAVLVDETIDWLVEDLMRDTYRRMGEFDRRLDLPVYGEMPSGLFAESGQWEVCETSHFEVERDDEGDVLGLPETVLDERFYRPVDSPATIDPVELYERARAELDPPDPPLMTAPPKDGLLFVKMPTWYWLEPGYWDAYSASASSPSGRLTVTVTAEPVMARWDPGDGSEPVLCYDAGREFVIGLSPYRGTECMHIYEHSSTTAGDGSDTWVLDVEVLFVASWEMTFDNGTEYDRGAIDGETRESELPLQVGEIQAIVID